MLAISRWSRNAQQLIVKHRTSKDRLVDAISKRDGIIVGADDDPSVRRCLLVQFDEMSAVESQDSPIGGGGIDEDLGIVAALLICFLHRQNVMSTLA